MEIWVNPACSTCRVALADGTTVIARDPDTVATGIAHEQGTTA
jgi:hypothetical protein